MNNFWSFIIFGSIFAVLIVCLRAGSTDSYEFKTKAIQKLDDELQHEFSKPNRWGYSVILPVSLSRMGYTHSLDMMINIRNMRLKSIPEIEKTHADVYGYVFTKINSIRIIRPFLAHFPISPNSFSLSIGFVGAKGNHFLPPYFVSIIMNEKTLEFIQREQEDVMHTGKVIETKSICDSELLKKFYDCKIWREPCSEKPSVPKVSYILPCCSPYQHAVFECAKTVEGKNNLNFVDLFPAESQFKDTTPFNMIFWGTQQLKKDDARKLAAECAGEFLKFVQNDKRTFDFMVERSTDKYIHDTATFPEPRHISLRISFWDENIDRQPEPYMAEIRLYDGKFKYFTADEGQRLVLAHEETFDEAQTFLKSLLETSSK